MDDAWPVADCELIFVESHVSSHVSRRHGGEQIADRMGWIGVLTAPVD